MPGATSTLETELQGYRQLAGMANAVIGMNVAGVTHEESLRRPTPGGNCLNWVVGHLVWVYNGFLPLLEQAPVLADGALERYRRGGPPLDDGTDAMDFGTLMTAWSEAAARVDAGLAALSPEKLDGPGVRTGADSVDESFRASVATVLFHQAYHAGQTGVLRRLVGREGAIR
jgi:uncharacterized damage-inducible protein DinB